MIEKMSLSERITYSTVLIRCKYSDGTFGSGTGFIMNLCENKENKTCVPVLITNKHVVKNSIETIFEFCKADESNNPLDTEPFGFTYKCNSWVEHPNPNIDLCCLPLAEAFNKLSQTDNRIFYLPLSKEIIPSEESLKSLSAMEEVVMVGYPIGLSDNHNHKPIIRQGITATHLKNDYQGEKHFLIDMACFPGSSGSPIFILNEGIYHSGHNIYASDRILFVGILFGGPQFTAQGILQFVNLPNIPHPVIQMPINLGIAIKSTELLEFENVFKN